MIVDEEDDRMEPVDLTATDVVVTDKTDGRKVALMDKLIGDAIISRSVLCKI